MHRLLFGLLAFALIGHADCADVLVAPNVPITAFHQVNSDLYRGGRPNAEGLKALADLGVKTILNIDNDSASIAEETRIAESLGLREISIPLSGFWTPSDADVDRILAVMADPANAPIYIHCQHGHDRTGLLVGLYRIEIDHWTVADAWTEMLDLGFHRSLIFLNNYFARRTRR
jgi:protein tyrosine/serine phosphatase